MTITAGQRTAMTMTVALGAALMLFPFYWLIIASTHTTTEIFSSTPPLLPGPHVWDNLSGLFSTTGFGRAVLNSTLIATVYTLVAGTICTLAGYAFAKFAFRGRNVLFLIVLVTLMLPEHLTLVPLFQMMVKLGWLNSVQGIVAPTLALPFGIFLMRQTLSAVPDEMLQSARIDGAGEVKTLWSVVLPTMKPALAALAIYLFLHQWNSFVWPLVVLRTPDSYTIPVALASLQGVGTTDYGQLLMGTLISVVPIAGLFLILQRHFVSGLLAGAVKQ
jgi:lactose/L-arabinose transport system permease protein